jgi:tetratricopeptide (TPR) repeat protein
MTPDARRTRARELLQLGLRHSDRCEPELAAEQFRHVIELEPGQAEAHYLLGNALYDLRRFDEAARACREAIGLDPEASQAHFNLGLAQFESEDLEGASRSFARCFALRRGEPWHADPARLRQPPAPPLSEQEMATNWVKLLHDSEQLDHLLAIKRLPREFEPVRDQYRALLAETGTSGDPGTVRSFDAGRFPLVAQTYKRPIHLADESSDGVVDTGLDWKAIEDSYLGAQPSVVVVDRILSAPGLDALRRICRESCFWNDIKPGYLGAYFFDGFASPVLLRLAKELRERMPRVIRDLPLQMMWGYKYESSLPGTGIGLHADAAAVNVNLWLTEDEANLAPDRGGLLIHAADAPRDWAFETFNLDQQTIRQHLDAAAARALRVPYKANRAAIFDSDLFHATDEPRFRPGYLSRRINITLLYGLRAAR